MATVTVDIANARAGISGGEKNRKAARGTHPDALFAIAQQSLVETIQALQTIKSFCDSGSAATITAILAKLV